jgi:hypothetical protein
MRLRLLVCLFAAHAALAASPNLVVNGGFEQNGGAGTDVLTGWTTLNSGSGGWFAQTGMFAQPKTYGCTDESVDPPPEGTFAAMTTMSFSGSHILYQDIAIPHDAGTVTLSFDLFLFSESRYHAAADLDYHGPENTQFRVDIMDPTAPVTDVGSGVWLPLYQSRTGDSQYAPYHTYIYDISAFAGKTIRLRFAEVDNVSCLNAGVDDVQITVAPPAGPRRRAVLH